MKPNFALKLSNDGIEYLHRDSGGWVSLGSVNFDSDDVEAGCARLVAEAKRLEPAGIRTKLVLPESQLRYATAVAPGPTDEARRYQIEAEIEALTPYTVDELVYDWAVEDDHALVVVCARETLAEAESFAEASGFNPISFVAAPEPGLFIGEPNFGETTVAHQYLPAGQRVQFDAEPVRVTSKPRAAPAVETNVAVEEKAEASAPRRAAPASAAPVATAPPTPSAAPSAGLLASARAALKPTRAAVPSTGSVPAPRAKVTAQPRPIEPVRSPLTALGELPVSTSEPLAKVGNLVRRMGTRLRREQARGKAEAASEAAKITAKTTAIATQSAETPAAPSAPPPVTPPPVTPSPVKPSSEARAAPVAPAAASAPSVAAGSAPSPEVPISFASRRRATPVVAASGNGASPTADTPGGRIAVVPGKTARTGPSLATRATRHWNTARQSVTARIAALRAAKPAKPAKPSTPVKPAKAGKPAFLAKPATPTSGTSTAASGAVKWSSPAREAGASQPIVATSRPPTNEREKASEAEALTIFGARGNSVSQPSLARRGLMVAGGVTLLLVAVAVWFIYFNGPSQTPQLAQNETAAESLPQIAAPGEIAHDAPVAGVQAPALAALPETSADAEPVAADTAIADAAPIAPDATQDAPESVSDTAATPSEAQTASDTPPAPEAQTAATEPDATTSPDRLLESLVQQALNEALPAETLGQADLATQASPPATASDSQQDTPVPPAQVSDTPQVTSGPTTAEARMSLPSGFDIPDLSETAFAAPPPPPPFGTEFNFGENGLVEATRDGALTPAGVTVYAGRPAAAPVPRPAGLVPAAVLAVLAAETPATETPSAEPPTAEAPTAEPPTAEPPAAEAPAAPAEVVFDDTPRADPALAAARPQPRSARVRAIGEQLAPAPPEPEPGGEQIQQQGAATAQPETDTAALQSPPPGGVSLAGLHPQSRPTDLVPPEALAFIQAASPAPDLDTASGTPEAVAASLRPSARPSDVAERARAILAAAGSTTGSRTDAESNPGETASTAAAQPSIPSAASVARQATQTDAINLREINLIGVFGTPEDRRALVRMSNGRVVRVQVGDSVDGGRVTAIGDNELRYSKNGRNLVLQIGG